MTEIPFVAQLGDAFEDAIAANDRRPARRRPPRLALVLAVVVLALGLTAFAVARALTGSEQLATSSLACYSSPGLGDVTVIANDGDPVAACAAALRKNGEAVPQLVACSGPGSVAVVPGTDASACKAAGLDPLTRDYAGARARTSALAAAILALEARRDCTPPDELAAGVRTLLQERGWSGWTVRVRGGGGPCGSVSGLDGAGVRRIDGGLDGGDRTVFVSTGASRSTTALLYGPGGLAPSLEDATGRRCFSVAAVGSLVRERAAASGRTGTVVLAPPLDAGLSMEDARGARYAAGCAVIVDVRPAPDGRGLVAIVPRPRP